MKTVSTILMILMMLMIAVAAKPLEQLVLQDNQALPSDTLTEPVDQLDFPPHESQSVMFQVEGLTVDIAQGTLKGKSQAPYKRLRQFLGIPYAKAPVGDLRWHAPQPATRWRGDRDATRKGYACPQLNPLERQSEDCLFLDIYTPTVDRIPEEGLPVMLWIHGGAFVFGSGSMLGVQSQTYIAEHRDVVAVSINYRLGALGFLAMEGGVNGNFGLLDQRFAMQWVKDNIAAFGGDPNRIVLQGESAGAMSIGLHLTSPNSQGLFEKAIMQSNILGVRFRSLKEAQGIGAQLAKKLRCKNIKCMRKRPLSKVLFLRTPIMPQNQDRFFADLILWAPIIDGVDFIDQPGALMKAGKFHKVPILMGINKDEAGMVVGVTDQLFGPIIGNTPLKGWAYEKIVKTVFHKEADAVLAQYPSSANDIEHNLDMLVDMATDYMSTCPTVSVTQAMSQAHGAHIQMYSFEFAANMLPSWFLKRCRAKNVCHAMEMPYVFHSLQDMPFVRPFNKEEHTMSHHLIDYWSEFATGESQLMSVDHDFGFNQGHDRERPQWPKLAAEATLEASYSHIAFTKEGNVEIRHEAMRAKQCVLWNKYGQDF